MSRLTKIVRLAIPMPLYQAIEKEASSRDLSGPIFILGCAEEELTRVARKRNPSLSYQRAEAPVIDRPEYPLVVSDSFRKAHIPPGTMSKREKFTKSVEKWASWLKQIKWGSADMIDELGEPMFERLRRTPTALQAEFLASELGEPTGTVLPPNK